MVGRNGTGRLTLNNVTSSVTINSTYRGSAEHGGLVGYAINADIIGCAFTGSLLGENSTGCSGLIGWKTNTENSNVNITDCLFAPTSVTVGTTNAYTLVRNSSGGVVNVTNSYYAQTLGTEQGKQRYSITPGEYVTMQNAGTPTEYGISGIVSYGVGIKYNDVLYAGKGDEVSLNLGYTWTDGYEGNGFKASAGTLQGNANPYTLTMPNDDVLVYTIVDDNPWDGEGTEQSPYLISYTSQWDLLAERVAVGTDYSGKYFQLAADITVTTMVGIDGQHAFSGTFDGGNHTLTLDYSTSADYAAPFRFVNGATIHDLTVDGTINTSKKFAAGLIGQAAGTIAIDHCHSSVTINSTVNGDGTHGGFVALIPSGETTIRGCLFDGSLLGILTDNNGGFVGWTANDGSLTIENSIFAPTEVTMVGDKTFARSNSDEHPTITNSFYTETFGDTQGKRIYKTPQEVADNGIYYLLTAFDKTYYGKVIITMQTTFDQTDEEVKPVPTIMTEDGILIPQEGNYTLDWREENGIYTVTITAAANAPFPIPNAQLVGSKTFEYTVVSMYAPKDLTATATSNTATISWTGAAERYKVRYKPTNLNTTYFTSFENGLPDDWTTIDADGDQLCWKEMGEIPNHAHSGAVFMTSESFDYDRGGFTPDNWLVSPQLSLNGLLKVWMKGQDTDDYRENVAIYVSTTGNAVADFTDIVLPETIVTNEYVEYSANLSQYAGEHGYIAIRHFNCTDQFRLNVDDFGLYNVDSSSGEWQEIEVTGTTAVITGLHPETYYAYQVEGIVGEDSYSSAIAVLQTKEAVPEVANVCIAPQQTTAKVSWEGHGDTFNVRYAVDNSITNTAKVTLTVGNVWDDGTGYQMLLDADANTFGSIIPQSSPLTYSGDASADVYANFEYKIPEYADGALNTTNVVINNSVTIEIPAGTYDWCITNPSPNEDMMFIASSYGNIGGRQDDYVFEAGMHYVFTVSPDGNYDKVDVEASPMYGEWTQVAVGNGALTTELTALTENTNYVVQVQAVLANGKTSEWSPAEKFATLGEGEIALYDDLDNHDVIEKNNDQTVNVTLLGRTLYKDGTWNTLCLPFNVEVDGFAGTPLEGAKVMTLGDASYANGTLTLNFKDAKTIEAGKPYIVKWTKADNYVDDNEHNLYQPIFKNVVISNVQKVVETKAVDFKGLYNPLVIAKSGDKAILYIGADNTLCYPEISFNINAFHAYFKLADKYINENLGDVNGDGAITVTDVMLLVNHILAHVNENFIEENADINGDGTITVTDVMVLVKMVLNNGQKSFNVVTNLDPPIGYDGGGSGPARAGENNLWEVEK